MAALTDAEKAFLSMAKMAEHREAVFSIGNWPAGYMRELLCHHYTVREQSPDFTIWVADSIAHVPELFPIVASTFEALTIERPELREHYDRAREAWEASQ